MKNKGYSLVLATALISGISIFINKFGVSVINPYVFTFLKNAMVAVFLSALIVGVKDLSILKSMSKKHWALLLAIGLIGGSIPFLIFFKGLSMTSAAGASFIQKTMFIWILIMAGSFLKEKISTKHIAAGFMMIVGNLLLLKLSDIRFDAGSLLILLATLLWAVENTISKYALRELPSKIIMWSRMFFGSVFILIFLAWNHQVSLLTNITAEQIGWTAVTSVLLFGYVYTWYTGLKSIKVSEAAMILMLGSPVTTMLSTVFSKPATGKEYFAAILIILGALTVFGSDKIMERFKKEYARIQASS